MSGQLKLVIQREREREINKSPLVKIFTTMAKVLHKFMKRNCKNIVTLEGYGTTVSIKERLLQFGGSALGHRSER